LFRLGGGRTHYTGYAEFERTGDHLRIVWHAPTAMIFLGTGIKIGNVLAVAYGYNYYPAVSPGILSVAALF
jgi:hypothetical protein